MAASLLLVAPAVAGGPDRLAEAIGSQLQVSCLSADRCMLSGGAHLSGALTRVVDGRRVDTYLEPAQEILSVSCPGRAGCLAIGPTVAGNGEELFTVNSHGVPVGAPRPLPLAPGTTVGRIACLSLTACQFSGVYRANGRWRLELGWWNGHSLTMHHALLPPRVTGTQRSHVACSAGVCETIGYETSPAVHLQADTQGYIVTTRNGVPVRVGYVPAYELHGNVCVSASLCYAGGFSDEEVGGVFPIVNGRPSSPIAVTGRVYGIGCARGVCTFAGAQVLGVPLTQGRLGTIRDGHVVTDVEVGRVSTFFNDVTVVGSTYTAIGLIPTGTATVIVSGPVGTTP